MKENNKGIIIVLSIVILVLIGTIVFMFVHDNFREVKNEPIKNNTPVAGEKEENNNDENEKNEINNSQEFVKISLDDPIVTSSMSLILKSNVNKKEMSSCLFQDRLWGLNSANINTLDDDSVLELIWENVSNNDKKTVDNGSKYIIDEKIFINAAKKVFGENYRIPNKTVNSIKCRYKMEYDVNNKNYVFSEIGTGDRTLLMVVNYYENAEKNNETLIITERVGFYFGGNLYSKPSGNVIVTGEITENNVMDYKDQFATYKYTFKLGNDNQYYFVNMTKTN